MRTNLRGRLVAVLLGAALAFPLFFGASWAKDQVVSGYPQWVEGEELWARKSGTTNTKQDLVSTDGALHVTGTVTTSSSSNKVDDAAFTPGTSEVTVMGAEADEAATDSVDEGDAGALRMTTDRQLYVKVGTALPAGTNNIGDVDVLTNTITDTTLDDWEAVAASQTDQACGAAGAIGDILVGLLVTPATTSPGAVQFEDGAGSAVTVFAGGASSVSNLVPFFIPLTIKSTSGAWEITTGANVSVICVGKFT